jgi:site-specific DNA-methyltransferase (adenine-specific)
VTQGFTSGMRTSLDDTWTTPREFFDELNKEFNFGLDAAALQNSTLVPDNWYGPDHPDPAARDALRIDWNHNSRGRPIWLNPPYGRVIKDWMRKANEVASGGGDSRVSSTSSH